MEKRKRIKNEFRLPNLQEMPVRTGELYVLDKYLSDKFTEMAMAEGYVPIGLPPVMPIDLLEDKFKEEDWQVKRPSDKQPKFVLTPEGTTMFAKLLEDSEFPTRVVYSDLQCVRENSFYQMGLEDVGSYDIKSTAKVIALADSYLKTVGFPKESYKIVINDLNILREYLKERGISSEETMNAVLKEIDKTSSKLYKLKKDESFGEMYKKEIENFQGSIEGLAPKEVMNELLVLLNEKELGNSNYPSFISISEKSQKELDALKSELDSYNVKYDLDPRLARGLEYYKSLPPRSSAIVFEIYAGGRQICGGGVYDGLPKKLNPSLDIGRRPELQYAVGFAFGRERVRDALRQIPGVMMNQDPMNGVRVIGGLG